MVLKVGQMIWTWYLFFYFSMCANVCVDTLMLTQILILTIVSCFAQYALVFVTLCGSS